MSNYVFFWGGIFSQWSKQGGKFTDGKRWYNCCEQYMMYHKAITMGDAWSASMIMAEPNPRKQKRLGRKVKNFSKHKWDQVKRDVVYRGNLLRAQQNPQFAQALLNTDNKTIVEASPYDRIWGIGYAADNALANRSNWGQNLLGQALMRVRAELRS